MSLIYSVTIFEQKAKAFAPGWEPPTYTLTVVLSLMFAAFHCVLFSRRYPFHVYNLTRETHGFLRKTREGVITQHVIQQ